MVFTWIAKGILRKNQKLVASCSVMGFFLGNYSALFQTDIQFEISNWHIDQLNRLGSPEINPGIYGQLIYNIGANNIQWRRDSLLNKWCCKNWTTTCKIMKLDHYFTHTQKLTQNECETWNHKLLEENRDSKVLDIGLGDEFLDLSPKTSVLAIVLFCFVLFCLSVSSDKATKAK